MYTVTTTNSLSFILEGTEQILSFKAKVSVERDDILSITWHEKFNDWPDLLIRMPGSYLPAWLMAGSYWSDDGWDFVLAKKPKFPCSNDSSAIINGGSTRERRLQSTVWNPCWIFRSFALHSSVPFPSASMARGAIQSGAVPADACAENR